MSDIKAGLNWVPGEEETVNQKSGESQEASSELARGYITRGRRVNLIKFENSSPMGLKGALGLILPLPLEILAPKKQSSTANR
jgi:hypothetical protein